MDAVTAIGAVGTAVGVSTKAIELLQQLRGLSGGNAAVVPEQVLRLALIDGEFNLGVLATVMKRRAVKTDDARFLQVAAALRLDAMSAMLLEWPQPTPPKRGVFADYDALSSQIEAQRDDETLLAHARYIVVAGQVLQALGAIDPAVRRPARLSVRLHNLREAHETFLDLLRRKEVVAHLVQLRERDRSSP